MVMLFFSPASANLLGWRWEGNGKVVNGEKFAANGFCGGVKCESRRGPARGGVVNSRGLRLGGRGKLCLEHFVGGL
jgi:hypothetical protein